MLTRIKESISTKGDIESLEQFSQNFVLGMQYTRQEVGKDIHQVASRGISLLAIGRNFLTNTLVKKVKKSRDLVTELRKLKGEFPAKQVVPIEVSMAASLAKVELDENNQKYRKPFLHEELPGVVEGLRYLKNAFPLRVNAELIERSIGEKADDTILTVNLSPSEDGLTRQDYLEELIDLNALVRQLIRYNGQDKILSVRRSELYINQALTRQEVIANIRASTGLSDESFSSLFGLFSWGLGNVINKEAEDIGYRN